ncbi:MAG: cache domain-containing protein, partial [Bacillota bacterium]
MMKTLANQFKEKFLSLTIRTRLLIFMLFLAIIPMIIVLNISMDTSINVIEKNAEQANISSIKMAALNIDALLTECVKQGKMISSDTLIRSKLKEPANVLTDSEDSSLNDRLLFLKGYTLNDIPFTCVMGKNGLKIKSTYNFFKDLDFRDTDWYKKVITADGPVWFDSHDGQFMMVSRTTFKYVTMGMPMVDKTTGEKIGVVLIDIQADIIYDNILHATSGGGSQMLFYDADYNAILNTSENDIAEDIKAELIRYKISDTSSAKALAKATDGTSEAYDISAVSAIQSFRTSIRGEAYYVCVVDLVSGWKMVDVMSISELTKDTGQIVPFSILIAIGVCIVAIFLSLQFSSSIAKPIRSLIKLMKKVETGDFTGKFHVKHADEIGMLGNSYNIMLDEIQRLMNTVLEEQRELLKAQFKILQEQINPHFLYNTLDSINWLSRMGRNDEVVV